MCYNINIFIKRKFFLQMSRKKLDISNIYMLSKTINFIFNMKILSSKSRGVTLVELSIVLAILGILIVATISGKSLIDMARATATIQYFKDRSVAMQLFDASYSATPGDATYANIADLTPKLFGDGANGINTYVETVSADYHFALAKLYPRTIQATAYNATAATTTVSGTITDATQILTKSKASGAYVFTASTDASTHFHAIGALGTSTYTAVASPMFKIIDIKTDDGAYNTGYVTCNQAITLGGTGSSATLTTDAGSTYDTSCIFAFSTAI